MPDTPREHPALSVSTGRYLRRVKKASSFWFSSSASGDANPSSSFDAVKRLSFTDCLISSMCICCCRYLSHGLYCTYITERIAPKFLLLMDLQVYVKHGRYTLKTKNEGIK